jgi:hypothetical protein
MPTIVPAFRDLPRAEAIAVLERHHVGRIAYSFRDTVDIEPIHFVFDGGWIFGRTSMGTKLARLAHHPWCAFEVDEAHDTYEWTSVVVKGSFHLVDAEQGVGLYDRALAAVRRLSPDSFTPGDGAPHRTILFGICANEITGRSAG